jgi:uncharacterized membrane protein YkoI
VQTPPNTTFRRKAVTAAAVIGALVSAGGVAGAMSVSGGSTDPAVVSDSPVTLTAQRPSSAADGTTAPDTDADADADSDRGPADHANSEEPLSGDLATKVTATAEAAVPGGTVDRVETDAQGATYEAHMTDANGNHVTVTFDDSLGVVEILDGPGGHDGAGDHEGPGGHGGHGRSGEDALTGDLATQVTAAAQAAVPGGTVDRVEADADDGATYEAHMTDANGNHVTVTFDDSLGVVQISDNAGH